MDRFEIEFPNRARAQRKIPDDRRWLTGYVCTSVGVLRAGHRDQGEIRFVKLWPFGSSGRRRVLLGYDAGRGRRFMSSLAPWISVLAIGVGAFAVGIYFQREERRRRERRKSEAASPPGRSSKKEE